VSLEVISGELIELTRYKSIDHADLLIRARQRAPTHTPNVTQ